MNPFDVAIEHLRHFGWVRGQLKDPDTGAACTAGAIIEGCVALGLTSKGQRASVFNFAARHLAARLNITVARSNNHVDPLALYYGLSAAPSDYHNGPLTQLIPCWNDTIAKDLEEVIAVLSDMSAAWELDKNFDQPRFLPTVQIPTVSITFSTISPDDIVLSTT